MIKKHDFEVLCSSALFTSVDKNHLKEFIIKKIKEPVIYKKHTDILTPQNYSECLFVILKGKASVWKSTDKGKILLSFLGPSDVFGMATLFSDNKGFENTVTASEDCRLLFININELTDLFTEFPQIAINYISILSQKIHYLNSKIESFSTPSPTSRLYKKLNEFADIQGSNTIILEESYTDLASSLSFGRTSLYRAFDELEEKGLILKNKKTITIL